MSSKKKQASRALARPKLEMNFYKIYIDEQLTSHKLQERTQSMLRIVV